MAAEPQTARRTEDDLELPLGLLGEYMPPSERIHSRTGKPLTHSQLRQKVWQWANHGRKCSTGIIFLECSIVCGRQVATPRKLREFIERWNAAEQAAQERKRAARRPRRHANGNSVERLPTITVDDLKKRGLL